jgi:hypothetical protein
MATTARGFRFPASTDTPDVPRDIGNLAADIDGMFSQGTFATRPAFGKVGREYYATDTGDTWLDIGTAWILKGSSSIIKSSGVPGGDLRGTYATPRVKQVNRPDDTGKAWEPGNGNNINYGGEDFRDPGSAVSDTVLARSAAGQLAVNGNWVSSPSRQSAPPLPATPYNGQEVIYTPSTGIPGVWHLKWNATAGKWEYIGGTPARDELSTAEVIAAGAAPGQELTTTRRLTLPFDGIWEFNFGCQMVPAGGAAVTGAPEPFVGIGFATAAAGPYTIVTNYRAYGGDGAPTTAAGMNHAVRTVSNRMRGTASAAVTGLFFTLIFGHNAYGGATTFSNRWVEWHPVYI